MKAKTQDKIELDDNIKAKMKLKHDLTNKMSNKKSYDELLDFYNQKQESFMRTSFFRKRLYLTIGFLLLIVLIFPFIPETNNDVGLPGTVMGIAFLGLVVLVDELFLGLYLFKTKNKIA